MAGTRILIYLQSQILHVQSYEKTDLESKSAQKGQFGFQVEGELRERKNEFREREVVFNWRVVLLGVAQSTS